jgi:hypothetical protein
MYSPRARKFALMTRAELLALQSTVSLWNQSIQGVSAHPYSRPRKLANCKELYSISKRFDAMKLGVSMPGAS